LNIRTLYAEVKERANGAGDRLLGTPGMLVSAEKGRALHKKIRHRFQVIGTKLRPSIVEPLFNL
jgi:hypothetical protein